MICPARVGTPKEAEAKALVSLTALGGRIPFRRPLTMASAKLARRHPTGDNACESFSANYAWKCNDCVRKLEIRGGVCN